MKPAFDLTDRLESILSIDLPKGRQNGEERIIENPLPECQPHAVLEAVGLILGRIEFELHAL